MNNLPLWFDDVEIGLAILDKTGHFVKINSYFATMINHTTDELIEKHFRVITHPDDLDSNQHEFDKVITDKVKRVSLVKRYITKTGNIIWAQVIVIPIGQELYLKQIIPIEDKKEQLKRVDNKIEIIESVNLDVLFKKYWWRFFQIIFIGLATIGGWVINAGVQMSADSDRIDKMEKRMEEQKNDNQTHNN